jgi:CDP-diacylglycerol--glycerol-3-phosphate 3-phosphatidyltransferase
MNVPNSLTVTRIFLVPFLVVVLLTRMENSELWGVGILLGAALTDWLDGFVARRRGQVTGLGVVLDPIADKFLIAAAFITLVELDLAPAWMVVIIIGREVLVIGLRAVAAAEGFSVPVSELGKIKMVLQVCAAALLILSSRFEILKAMGTVALWLVVFFAMVSAARYMFQFWRGLTNSERHTELIILPPPRKKPDALAR